MTKEEIAFDEYTKRYRREYPKRPEQVIKNKARHKTMLAVRNGTLKKEPCVKCGALKVEAHHPDYSKPLDVIWMCRPCHLVHHRKPTQGVLNEESTNRSAETVLDSTDNAGDKGAVQGSQGGSTSLETEHVGDSPIPAQQPDLMAYFVAMGRIGGAAGRGAKKTRSPEFYKHIAALAGLKRHNQALEKRKLKEQS